MPLTRAVPHIRLCEATHAKIAALDALAAEYQRVCQAYTTLFCTDAAPNPYAEPCVHSALCQRWQRVAIQQAAGIARSWRSNCATAYHDYLDQLAVYQEQHPGSPTAPTTPQEPAEGERANRLPEWREWQTPVLTQIVSRRAPMW
jgi:hypothetical protein